MNFILGIAAFKFSILLVHAQFHDSRYDFWLHSPLERSVDVMTDVVNDLGVRILQQHVSPGNVAFSPTGIGFVLIALYEGSAGRGRQQIGYALGLPHRNQVTRIGMRDINRRLKSYLNAEGFLGGLTLNKDNINLRSEYEDILRFYGFDLPFNTSSATIPIVPDITVAPTDSVNITGTSETTSNTVTMSQNASPAVTSTMGIEIPATTLATINNATDTASSAPNMDGNVNASNVITPPATGTVSERISQSSGVATSTPTIVSTGQNSNDGNAGASTVSVPTNIMEDLSPTAGTNIGSSADLDNGISTSTVSTQTTLNDASTPTMTVLPATTRMPGVMTTNALPAMGNASSPRSKRSASNVDGYSSSYSDDGSWMQDLNVGYQLPDSHSDYYSRDETHISFLVNGCDVVSVPAATYTTILPFAYFPSLKAVALEFPLDDPRYNIIMFLPIERVDTFRLVRALGSKTLRLLRKHLRSTWVKATIPSFMLRGFVTLTPFLQRLGIRDVFEPRIADLSPMTSDRGVYARDVQQNIAVNIRSDMKIDELSSRQTPRPEASSQFPSRRDAYRFLRPDNGMLERAEPASFIAEHPFVYFIIDAHTSVSLIAGRVDDPLNSRVL